MMNSSPSRAEELAAKIEEMPAEILHTYPFLLDATALLRDESERWERLMQAVWGNIIQRDVP